MSKKVNKFAENFADDLLDRETLSIEEVREQIRKQKKNSQERSELIKKFRLKAKPKIANHIKEKIIERVIANEPICYELIQKKKEENRSDKNSSISITEEDFAKFDRDFFRK